MDGVISEWSGALAEGAAMTVGLALATLPFGLALGLAAALARTSHIAAARGLAEAYTTVFRALPELLTLLLIYFGGQILLQKIAAATGLPVAVQVSPFVAGLVALALVFGAYSSEVFIAALTAVERGQIEAARSFGMSSRQVFRRVRLPQALRFALPGLGNNWLVLLKDTSLVSVIALNDLLRETTIAVQATREPFKFYAVACAIYLAMTALSTLAIARAERAAGRGFRGAR
ncbi:ABC transporter permease [Rhodomicrobium sp.]|uniref:ABC transporter permease n=1 Tax=Rhodomicrobium sp. TaxID=2720632 RepID=UPI0039E31AC6